MAANALVDALMTLGANFCVFDNLSSRNLQNIKQWLNNPKFTFIKGDLLKPTDLKKLEEEHFDLVFHLAANPEVKVGSTNPNIHFQQNLAATQNLLEHHRKTRNTPTLIFTSTSTVYGEPTKIHACMQQLLHFSIRSTFIPQTTWKDGRLGISLTVLFPVFWHLFWL